MTIEQSGATADRHGLRLNDLPFWWPLALGLMTMAVPTIINMAQQTWKLESGAHGPIVLATGFWLLHHDGLRLADARHNIDPSTLALVLAGLALSLPLYIFGRAFDFVSLEYVGLYGTFLMVILRLFGLGALRQHAFPLFYLALAVPPPGWFIAGITAPLQNLVSGAAGGIASILGYPVARQGVLLFVGPYQLLVEDACSGLNSLFGLSAISLLYIFLMHRASWRYSLLLLAAVLPIAILVNIIRILALIAITWRFGDATAQGFLHGTTGLALFAVALVLIFGLDSLIEPLVRRLWRHD
jgi:exosortase